MIAISFPHLLHAFFHDWLGGQRNLSRHTVLSYRDTWRLFLRFVASQKSARSVAQVTFDHFTEAQVLAFLRHCEEDRHTSTATRNCRLAALRSFFRFVADREPTAAARCAEILRIPTKRAPKPALCYLDAEEVTAILNQPNRATLLGQRDYLLLSMLYNTGARIQEVLNLSPRALRLDPPAQVRLVGKGRKERICPIWPETADLLKAFMAQRTQAEDQPIFRNRFGRPLGAAGVRFKLHQYIRAATRRVPSLTSKHVTPHTYRHYLPFLTMSGEVSPRHVRGWKWWRPRECRNRSSRHSFPVFTGC